MTTTGMEPSRPEGGLGRETLKPVFALGVTQMIAWGTTYYLPAVFVEEFRRDLGLTATTIFSGVAITLIVSALLAWPVGRLMDRIGAGRLMAVGSVVLAAGLVVLGVSTGYWSYAAAWSLFGLGMALSMSNAAFVAMAQIAGAQARRGIVIVMLFGGMAATVFWPLTLWLAEAFGWRTTCFLFAGLHVALCAPLHAGILAGATSASQRQDIRESQPAGLVAPDRRTTAAWLIMAAVAGNGFVSWGLDLHLIAILREFGLSAGLAVAVAAWKGPATLLARGFEIVAARLVTPMGSALVAGALIPFGLALALLFAAGLPAAVLFITLYSFGTGLMTVARATLPLTLLGAHGYGATMGRMTLPTQVIYALSPMFFGLFLERFGLTATLWLAMVASLASLAALLALARLAKS